jgi:hypothetical protein
LKVPVRCIPADRKLVSVCERRGIRRASRRPSSSGKLDNVVDPADPRVLVTLRASLFDFDLRVRTALSISSLEHVGTGQYGLWMESGQARAAL